MTKHKCDITAKAKCRFSTRSDLLHTTFFLLKSVCFLIKAHPGGTSPSSLHPLTPWRTPGSTQLVCGEASGGMTTSNGGCGGVAGEEDGGDVVMGWEAVTSEENFYKDAAQYWEVVAFIMDNKLFIIVCTRSKLHERLHVY